MRIAVIGTGIAGNVAARRLHDAGHDVHVFEAAGHVGGHTHTHEVEYQGDRQVVDTGFIVFNDWTYPNFIALLDELGVASQPSSMSFSVRNELSGLEYNGTSINTLFAQRGNLLRPRFHRMIRDILRFNREAPKLLIDEPDLSLGAYLAQERYSAQFIGDYLLPMGAAIWSTDPDQMLEFPAHYLVRFFHNHGMLSVDQRPVWRVVRGGSARYVEPLVAPFRSRIRLNTAVASLQRSAERVSLRTVAGDVEHFDHVFVACHSDQALRMLDDPTELESSVLGAIPYQVNSAVLHTDTRLLPKRRVAWAAWNYHVTGRSGQRIALTYDMNILQTLHSPHTWCVTLNRDEAIDPAKVVKQITYHHPMYTRDGVAAQKRQADINGPRRTFYCGAYWRYGFHEDGVVSALRALSHFQDSLARSQPSSAAGSRSVRHVERTSSHEQRDLPRAA